MAQPTTSAKIDPRDLLQALADHGIYRAVGVPDSTLEPLMELLEGDNRFSKISAVNECEAVSIAMGQYLASGSPSLVYLQNSGFGKTIHPITSLLTNEICATPALLLIGWRGFPDPNPDAKADEPQHVLMGRILPDLLKTIEVPFEVLGGDLEVISAAIERATVSMKAHSQPYALIVKPGSLIASKKEKAKRTSGPSVELSRQQALELLLDHTPPDTVFVSTTGKASRELYFIREARGQGHEKNLYVVGGMGCASAIALGIAVSEPPGMERTICAVDGDGAALMQLGTLASIGHSRPRNLLHVVIDNESYESTGGQPSISPTVDFVKVALACGYSWARHAEDKESFVQGLKDAHLADGPRLLVLRTTATSDPSLGRPRQTPRSNVEGFIANLKASQCPANKS